MSMGQHVEIWVICSHNLGVNVASLCSLQKKNHTCLLCGGVVWPTLAIPMALVPTCHDKTQYCKSVACASFSLLVQGRDFNNKASCS